MRDGSKRNVNAGRMAVISCTESGEPMEERITDTLADVLHYAKACKLDPRQLIERAMRHQMEESRFDAIVEEQINKWANDPGAI